MTALDRSYKENKNHQQNCLLIFVPTLGSNAVELLEDAGKYG